MKKKVITAFLLIGIGGLLIAAGYKMGGHITAFEIGPICWFGSTRRTMYDIQHQYSVHHVEETPLAAEGQVLEHLNADIAYAALEIIPHDGPAFSYRIENNSDDVGAAVTVKNRTVYIKAKKYEKQFFTLFGGYYFDRGPRQPKTVITLTIPKDAVFETADIRTGTGSVLLDGFQVRRSFVLQTGVGSADIRNITASHVDISTGVGESVFSNCVFDDIKMAAGIGKLWFDGKILNNLRFSSGIGTAELHITGRKEDYSVHIQSGIGPVFVDGIRFGSIGNAVQIHNADAAHKIHIESGIGQVNVTFKEPSGY